MTIWQNTFFSQLFTLKDCSTGLPVNIAGWTFHGQFRLDPEEPVLLDLTSAEGEFVIHDEVNGMFSMQIQAADTATLPEDKVRFDVLRTAPAPGPILLFWGKTYVKAPITQISSELPGPSGPQGTDGTIARFSLADDASQTFTVPAIPSGSMPHVVVYSTALTNNDWFADMLVNVVTATIVIELGVVKNVTVQLDSAIGVSDPDGTVNVSLHPSGVLRVRNRTGGPIQGIVWFST